MELCVVLLNDMQDKCGAKSLLVLNEYGVTLAASAVVTED